MTPDHTRAPKNLDANKKYRALCWNYYDTPALRKKALERAKHDVVWWIDTWAWQFNPDNRGHEVEPFILYPFQEKALERTMRRLLLHRLPVVVLERLGAGVPGGHVCLPVLVRDLRHGARRALGDEEPRDTRGLLVPLERLLAADEARGGRPRPVEAPAGRPAHGGPSLSRGRGSNVAFHRRRGKY
jgi:hypothetical protein